MPAVLETDDVEDLARRAAEGDRHALDRLLRAIEPDVASRCRRMLADRGDAEEACQDTLIAVARRIERFEGRSRFSTWLYRITSNAAIDTYRRLKDQSLQADELAQRPDVSRTSVIAGTRIDLLEALEHIEPLMAEPVVLRDVYGLDYAEIAEALDVPVGTVKSRIHTGRAAIRTRLAR